MANRIGEEESKYHSSYVQIIRFQSAIDYLLLLNRSNDGQVIEIFNRRSMGHTLWINAEKMFPLFCFSAISPLCLGGFVTYFGQTKDAPVTLNEAFWYASGMLLPNAFFMFTYPMFTLYLFKMSSKIRIGCSGLIYRKILQMSKSSIDGGQIGKIVNLLSTDLRTFEDLIFCVYTLWRCPFDIVVSLIVIYMEIGVAAFIGMGFLACFIPIKGQIN